MKRIFLTILIILFLPAAFFAQRTEQKYISFVETGRMSSEEIALYLDGLTNELGKNPNSKAHINIYGGSETFFSYPYIHGAVIKAYLKNNLKVPVEKFSIQFCNVNREAIRTQFFVLEANDKIEPCQENLTVPEKTVLFETLRFYDKAEFSSKKPFEETFIDVVGPSEQEYSQTSQAVLLKLLNQSPDSKIYLIGYMGTNRFESARVKLDTPKALNKLFRQIVGEFVGNGIDASGIVKINGGYRDDQKSVEMWFVPKGGEIPKPTPDYFPKKRR
jgi:hypothetical protein